MSSATNDIPLFFLLVIIKIKRQREKRNLKVNNLVQSTTYGWVRRVKVGSKNMYSVKCHLCDYESTKIEDHIASNIHGECVSKEDAQFYKSRMVRKFVFSERQTKANRHYPLPCKYCKR